MIIKESNYFLKISTFGEGGFIRPIKEDKNKIEFVILINATEKKIYLFDHFFSFSLSSKLKDRENNNPSFFDLHAKGLDKMPISEKQYHKILNSKISFLHSCNYINFLKKFKLDEWII
jgi:hypothetical protein